jgi:2-keto-4-pentenoate hydratase
MLSDRDIELAASQLTEQRRQKEDVAFPHGLTVSAPADIYRIQARVTQALGGDRPPVGFKVSVLPAALMGTPEPEWWFAGVPNGRLLQNGSVLESSHYRRLGVECEIGCRIGVDASGRASARSIMPVLEVIEQHHSQINGTTIRPLIASGILNSALVLGPETEGWPDVKNRRVHMTRNGATVISKSVAECFDPNERLRGFLAHAAEFGWQVIDGVVISLGSCNQDVWFEAGDEIVGEIEGFGRVSVSIR